ncbi:hypothetical protein ACUHMQ_10050 [Chitinimonas sp. PSY-7]|uniref:hypothetical protein n=1 Tax=Chitinimonas sp. PSY-7 TaxID=3459088 RepID=UPI00404009F0
MLLSSTEREDAHRFFEQNAYQGDRKRGFVKYRRSFGNPFSAGEPCAALVEKETL